MKMIDHRPFSMLSALLLVATPLTGAAQGIRDHALESVRGGTVRLRGPTLPGGSLIGWLVRWNAESITVATSRGPIATPRSAIEKVQVGRGKNRFLWGVLGGLAGYALVGAKIAIAPTNDYDDLALAVLLPTIGAGVGYLAAPERWQTVAMSPTRMPTSAQSSFPGTLDRPVVIGVRFSF
jgi:hypothetical protein